MSFHWAFNAYFQCSYDHEWLCVYRNQIVASLAWPFLAQTHRAPVPNKLCTPARRRERAAPLSDHRLLVIEVEFSEQ